MDIRSRASIFAAPRAGAVHDVSCKDASAIGLIVVHFWLCLSPVCPFLRGVALYRFFIHHKRAAKKGFTRGTKKAGRKIHGQTEVSAGGRLAQALTKGTCTVWVITPFYHQAQCLCRAKGTILHVFHLEISIHHSNGASEREQQATKKLLPKGSNEGRVMCHRKGGKKKLNK